MKSQSTPADERIAVNEHVVAKAINMSLAFVRKDRRTKKLIPFYRVGGRILYNLDRVRAGLAALEEGGPQPRARRAAGSV